MTKYIYCLVVIFALLMFGCGDNRSRSIQAVSAKDDLYRALALDTLNGGIKSLVNYATIVYWQNEEYDKALSVYRRAAHDGSGDAALLVSNAYMLGTGIETNEDSTVAWLKIAAKYGNEEAVRRLNSHNRQQEQK